ncbi:MAG TPA: response regulator, partial [Longimicrobiales bacterium]
MSADRRVLLVDDDRALLETLGKFFTSRGWSVARASDARAAVAAFERDRPDVIVLDLQLPGLSGLELLELLRARDPDATVLLLTGHGDIQTAVEAMRLGAENFLTKPMELPHLEAAAERAYEKAALKRTNRYYAERDAGEK